MEQDTCKELVQYLSPCPYYPRPPRNVPPLTFFSLPREIRDSIYHYTLVSTSNIIVWKGKLKHELLPIFKGTRRIWSGEPTSRLIWRAVSHEETSISLSTLNIKLLFCSKVVSREAAIVFYKKNIFAFEGDHNWDPVVHWLKTIGTDNRNSLAILEVCGKRPDQVWQNHCGERIHHPLKFSNEEIYLRHPYFATPIDGFKYGCVDNINPILEEVFILFGQRVSNKQVTIIMRTGRFYPGGGTDPVDPDELFPEDGWYSMELPNLIEKFLELHSTHSMKRSVEVIWKGLTYKRVLETEFMENLGWNISTSPVENEEALAIFGKYYNKDETFVRYTLKRKKLMGPLITQDPSPYSDMYVYSQMNREDYL
ncbi:hypothetical protein BGAL_0055g00470 [Botrytis galanthina]|uniref:F-box domain-containing protein n=1 Tax=Botrytis galanthina TaxID=278940 RepID=A0A4S8R5Z2_9HELO|nr:hypothetical protein BGAL_0055g00470 [Botrytis galanthina]